MAFQEFKTMVPTVDAIIERLSESDARKLKYELGRWRQHISDGKFKSKRTEDFSALIDLGLIRVFEDPPNQKRLIVYEFNPLLEPISAKLNGTLRKLYPELQMYFDPDSGEMRPATDVPKEVEISLDGTKIIR